MKELLISVTNFFRDPLAFDALDGEVLPRIVRGQGRRTTRCASGFRRAPPARRPTRLPCCSPSRPRARSSSRRSRCSPPISTSRRSPPRARPSTRTSDVADLSEERLRRFFVREAGGYRVRRELREMVLFAPHNVISDPPFSHLDLISCRNLLIYLNRAVQERVIETFHFALRPGGFLFLAPSETPDASHDLFAVVDKAAHIYESRTVTTRLHRRSPAELPVVPIAATRACRRRPAGRPNGFRRASCTSGCSSAMRRRRSSSPRTTTSCTCPSGSAGSCRSPAASRRAT